MGSLSDTLSSHLKDRAGLPGRAMAGEVMHGDSTLGQIKLHGTAKELRTYWEEDGWTQTYHQIPPSPSRAQSLSVCVVYTMASGRTNLVPSAHFMD